MPDEPVIETHALCRRFERREVLRDVNLAIPRGGVHAVVGRNGAGKSTLFRILLGFLAPTSGSSRILDADSTAIPPATRGRIGFVYETHPLPAWMAVGSLRAMHRQLHPGWSDVTFDEVASLFRLPSRQTVGQLSRGERAGLALALALAPGPELLLLDEPTVGLDVVASRAFLESLLFAGEGERERGTIVYSSHQMAEVERIADRLIVLDRGAVVADSAPDALRDRIGAWVIDSWPSSLAVDAVPGLLQARTIDGQLHLVVLDQGDDLGAFLAGQGARGIARTPVGFERAMDAFLGRQDRGDREENDRCAH